MKAKVTNYTFDASAQTVTFTDINPILLDSVLYIQNVTDGIAIYNPFDPSKLGSVATNVLTLDFDTTAMDDADDLLIYYDDPNFDALGENDDAAIITDTTGSLNAKIRGLIKIYADIWDSSNHWLKVSLKSKLQVLITGQENDNIGISPHRREDAFDKTEEFADATTHQEIQALSSGKSIYISDIVISTDTEGWVQLDDTDGTLVIPKIYLPARGTWSKTYNTPIKVTVSKGLYGIAENPGNVTFGVNGYVY